MTISAKNSILDVLQGYKYASGFCGGSKRYTWNVGMCQNDYSIQSKLEFSPYSEVIHRSVTFKLTKA